MLKRLTIMLSSPTIGKMFNLFLLHDNKDSHYQSWVRACQNPVLVRKIHAMIKELMRTGKFIFYKEIHSVLIERVYDKYGYCLSRWAFYNWFRGRYPIPLFVLQELLLLWGEICQKLDDEFLVQILRSIDSLQVASGSNKVKVQTELTDELAYFLGIIIGDGSLPNDGRMRFIHLRKGNKEFVTRIYPELVARLFGVEIRTRYSAKDNTYDSSFGSRIVFRYLTKIFGIPSGSKARIVEIPPLIFDSNASIKTSFLRGLFDTDGGISGGKVEFSTSSKRMFEGIKKVLKEFGFEPRPYIHHDKRYDKLHYYLFLRRSETNAFMSIIGSCNPKRISAFQSSIL